MDLPLRECTVISGAHVTAHKEQRRTLREPWRAGLLDWAGKPANVFHAGPRMHKLEGIVRPETISFEFDIARGDFFADFWWHDSSEDDEHIAAFGIGTAIPDTLIESELFGVDRGAYIGAVESRAGRFERAKGGTLFLDEIVSLSLVAQGKLLRALQERVIERVGGQKLIPVDVRIVAATNVDLRDEVAAGRFREDLFFRLNVFPIALPPLKERRDDIPLLMETFLRRYCEAHGRDVPGFTPRAVQALLQYDFPGNVRELQNLIERGVIMVAPDEPIDVHHLFRGGEHLDAHALGLGTEGRLTQSPALRIGDQEAKPAKAGGNGASSSRRDAAMYRKTLVAARHNIAEAARQLGITRAQMAYRIKRLGIL